MFIPGQIITIGPLPPIEAAIVARLPEPVPGTIRAVCVGCLGATVTFAVAFALSLLGA
jgi:hypothetical protein